MVRRTDRQIPEAEALAILRAGEYGVLSTVSAQGRPYGVPVNFCVLDDDIYFHCALEGAKLDNIEHSPEVSFCVVGATEVLPSQFGTKYESCVIEGRASEVFDDKKQRALEGLVDKYSQGFLEAQGRHSIDRLRDQTRVFKISIVSVSGKARRE
jgi:nitroimidazol reductase NimA-like FMN-containing flavoprotein (pyridoxamine 5'-phosphate oxidase superfamily)